MIRRITRLLRPIQRRIDRRIDAYAVRRYHSLAFRDLRLMAVHETDPRIARFYEAQARAHRRFAGPITELTLIDA